MKPIQFLARVAVGGALCVAATLALAETTPTPQSPNPANGAIAPSALKPVGPEDVRPPRNILTDCSEAPPEAKTVLPAPLAAWAVIYCTTTGYIFSANERYFASYPEAVAGVAKGQRAIFNSNALDNQPLDTKNPSYFRSIAYIELSAEDLQRLIAVDPMAAAIIGARKPWRIDLATSGGTFLSLLVLGPEQDPFWVFPLTAQGISAPAFSVVSLGLINAARSR